MSPFQEIKTLIERHAPTLDGVLPLLEGFPQLGRPFETDQFGLLINRALFRDPVLYDEAGPEAFSVYREKLWVLLDALSGYPESQPYLAENIMEAFDYTISVDKEFLDNQKRVMDYLDKKDVLRLLKNYIFTFYMPHKGEGWELVQYGLEKSPLSDLQSASIIQDLSVPEELKESVTDYLRTRTSTEQRERLTGPINPNAKKSRPSSKI